MKNRITQTLLALVLSWPLAGCASIVDLRDGQRIYGGVRDDASLIAAAFGKPGHDPLGHAIAKRFAPLAVLDLPLSLALDTAALPITVAFYAVRYGDDPTAEASASRCAANPTPHRASATTWVAQIHER